MFLFDKSHLGCVRVVGDCASCITCDDGDKGQERAQFMKLALTRHKQQTKQLLKSLSLHIY